MRHLHSRITGGRQKIRRKFPLEARIPGLGVHIFQVIRNAGERRVQREENIHSLNVWKRIPSRITAPRIVKRSRTGNVHLISEWRREACGVDVEGERRVLVGEGVRRAD